MTASTGGRLPNELSPAKPLLEVQRQEKAQVRMDRALRRGVPSASAATA
ncbi:hypothetical protein [Bosea sp. LjRoot237]